MPVNQKISEFVEDTSPSGDDLVPTVNDPAGTPVNKKVKLLNLLKRLFLADGTQLLLTTVGDGEYLKRDGTNLTSGVPSGTGAPTDATYITQTANGGLSNEQAMGALATGLVKNTTTTGVQSIATPGTDYVVPTATVNVQTGTTYTLQASDNGNVVTLNNASAITLTVPSGLGAGFNCLIIQKGAGQVTFTASSTTINNRQSHTKTAGQHALCTLVADVSNNFYLGGDTAT